MHQLKTEMDVYQAILARRSVREYSSKKVDERSVRILVEAAVRAPTAMHREPWAFVIVQNKAFMQGLSDRVKPFVIEQMKVGVGGFDVLKNPDFNVFYESGTLIIICAKGEGSFADADCWLAAENLMLAACAMHLGTCVIGAALQGLNDKNEKMRLGIAEDYKAVVPIIVGFPVADTKASSRKMPLILNWL